MHEVTPMESQRGSVTVEYTFILVLVTLGCTLTAAALGAPLIVMFRTRCDWLLLPFP
jgi:Flp pilus assembly pilin Flp